MEGREKGKETRSMSYTHITREAKGKLPHTKVSSAMEDQCVASSILQSQVFGPSTTTDAFLMTRQKRTRDYYLYDCNGQRLKGLKGEAAKLMHNHRFFSSEEEIHRLEQTLVEAKRSAAASSADGGGAGGFGATADKLPTLPDMFGVVQSTAACGDTHYLASGDVAGHKAMIPPMHRWSFVRRRHITLGQLLTNSNRCGDTSSAKPRPSTSGHCWVRADALHVENSLMSAFLAQDKGCGGEVSSGGVEGDDRHGDFFGLQLTPVLLASPDVDFSVFHYKEPSPFSSFTVTAQEYATLELDDDMYQPLVFSSNNGNIDSVPCRFDFLSTSKLLTLYERFGNFVVVADRWCYADSYNLDVLSATMPNDRSGSSISKVAPPVEALMERYKLVSEAVMHHRLFLLREAIKNNTLLSEFSFSPSSPGKKKCNTCAEKSGQAEEQRIATSTYLLTSLMEKHPILVSEKKREEWLVVRFKELCQGDGLGSLYVDRKEEEDEMKKKEYEELHKKKIVARIREDFLRQCMVSATFSAPGDLKEEEQQRVIQAACRARGNEIEALLLASCSPPPAAPPFWYDGILEQARRRRLREFLLHEARMNVPYLRAVVALKRLNNQATLLFEKLSVLMYNGTALGEGERQAEALKHLESLETKTSDCKRSLPGKKTKGRQHQLADTLAEDSYHGVQQEVCRVPLQCERLRLSVQAGWFLPTTSGGVRERPSGTNMVANKAFSNIAEALLLTLPSSVPRVYLGVEQELEKHLWEDHRALCDDSAEVQQLLAEVRVVYTQNVILRRFAGRCGTLEASLKKLAAEAIAMDA